MTSLGTRPPLMQGNLLRYEKPPWLCFHPPSYALSLPATARFPASFLESDHCARVHQGKCNAGGQQLSRNFAKKFDQFRSSIRASRALDVGLKGNSSNASRNEIAGGWKLLGKGRHAIRVLRATEDGGGEKGGSKNTTSTATEEPEKEKDSKTNSTPASPSTPSPRLLPRFLNSWSAKSVSTSYAMHLQSLSGADKAEKVPVNVQLDAFRLMELIGPEKVDPDDVKMLKDKLFGYTTFWVTGQEPFGDLGEGVLLLGNLRGKREEVFAKLQKGLRDFMGRKYDLFMVEEPNAEEEDPRGGPRVSFVLLRKEVSDPGPTTLWQYVIAAILFVLSAGSCLELGIASQLSRLPPNVVQYFTNPESMDPPDLQVLVPFVDSALPLAYGVFGVQLFHEVGHWLAAAPRKVKMGIPYLIPNITLGSFGAITQFKSILPDRTAKFDISVAGPLAGAILSLSMLGLGLWLSVNPDASEELVQVPSLLFQGSLLLGTTSRAVLGYDAMHAATVAIHPLVIAGWCGLTTTAFNLMPVGCLDGGRTMQAAFGKTALNVSGLFTYLLLGLGALGGPLSLPWGLYILIVQRAPEKPALNNVSEVGTLRKVGFSIILLFALAMLLPLWDGLTEELGIGLGAPMF